MKALNSIVTRVDHIAQLMSDMAVGSAEQFVGLGEINVGDSTSLQHAAANVVAFATPTAHGSDWDTEPEAQPRAMAANESPDPVKVWQKF